jgi:hypothetical protein
MWIERVRLYYEEWVNCLEYWVGHVIVFWTKIWTTRSNIWCQPLAVLGTKLHEATIWVKERPWCEIMCCLIVWWKYHCLEYTYSSAPWVWVDLIKFYIQILKWTKSLRRAISKISIAGEGWKDVVNRGTGALPMEIGFIP